VPRRIFNIGDLGIVFGSISLVDWSHSYLFSSG
jgi:hypothetical protein